MLYELKLIESLNRSDAIALLRELCEDEKLREKIADRAKNLMSDVNATDVEDAVFSALNSIQVEEYWERSGDTYFGYNEPMEVAYEMVEEAIEIPLRNMKKYGELGMHDVEEAHCIGIIAGLLRYDNEGSNEFHDAAPDDPHNIAYDVVYEWKKDHLEADLGLIQKTVDRFEEGWDVRDE